MRLYDLTQNELQLLRMLEDGQDVGDTLESIQDLTVDKLEGYAKVMKTLEANAEALKTEAKRMKDVEASCRKGVDRMKKAIYDHMKATDKKKVDGQLFKFSIAKNKPSLEVLNDTIIPSKYFNTPAPVLDKESVIADLKAKKEVPGVMMKQGESLRIK